MRRKKIGILLAVILLSSACERMPAFQFESFAQSGIKAIPLNETLVFRFNQEIDPTTFDPVAMTIGDVEGRSAIGEWEIRGKDLLFKPRLPMSSDCSDCGLLADRDYTIRIQGFPAFCALRSTEGEFLDQEVRLGFRTASKESTGHARFVDPQPESGPNLLGVGGGTIEEIDPAGIVISPGASLQLSFSEPIYPPSLNDPGVIYVSLLDNGGSVDDSLETQPLICRFDGSPYKVCLEPSAGFQSGKAYKLYRKSLALTDYAGKLVEECRFDYLWIVCPSP